MSTKNNQNLIKELDYNFLDEEWSDDEPQTLQTMPEIVPITPSPIVEEKKEEITIPVIENERKQKKLTARQKLKQHQKRFRERRGIKPKLKKQTINILSNTKNMMIYLEKNSTKKLREELSVIGFKEHLEEKFPKLSKDYNKIFEKTLTGEMNLNMLSFLCAQHDRLRRGGDKYNTDVVVGQKVFDNYGKPI